MVDAVFFDGDPPSPAILPSLVHTHERRAHPVDGSNNTTSTEFVKGIATRTDERSHARCVPSRRPVVGLVFDTQNLRGAGLRLGVERIDYKCVRDAIVGNDPWLGVACVAKPTNGRSVAGFCTYLRSLGLRVSVWDSPKAAGRIKADLDPLLICEATAMITTLPLLGLCVIGGDVDYRVLADACRFRRIKFGIAAFVGSISSTLAKVSDWVLELDESFAVPRPGIA